jgi:hypothetical protein
MLIEISIAFGAGAIICKFIDFVWVQPFLVRSNISSWLREKRLKSYTALSENILSFGLKENYKDPFTQRALAAETILLTDCKDLCNKIDSYIARRDQLFRIQDREESSTENPKEIYQELLDEGDVIINELKIQLRN